MAPRFRGRPARVTETPDDREPPRLQDTSEREALSVPLPGSEGGEPAPAEEPTAESPAPVEEPPAEPGGGGPPPRGGPPPPGRRRRQRPPPPSPRPSPSRTRSRPPSQALRR